MMAMQNQTPYPMYPNNNINNVPYPSPWYAPNYEQYPQNEHCFIATNGNHEANQYCNTYHSQSGVLQQGRSAWISPHHYNTQVYNNVSAPATITAQPSTSQAQQNNHSVVYNNVNQIDMRVHNNFTETLRYIDPASISPHTEQSNSISSCSSATFGNDITNLQSSVAAPMPSTSANSTLNWVKKAAARPQPGKTRTKDKYRVVYSDFQRQELEREFRENSYITIRRKTELATALALSERQIKIWFQNRRAKRRKSDMKKENPRALLLGADVMQMTFNDSMLKIEPNLIPHGQHNANILYMDQLNYPMSNPLPSMNDMQNISGMNNMNAFIGINNSFDNMAIAPQNCVLPG